MNTDFFKQLAESKEGAEKFPFMPEGQAFDMGTDVDGKPLFDQRILIQPNFSKSLPIIEY